MPALKHAVIRRQQAQAVTEFLIVWPVILLAICFIVQLMWLWWAQQTLHTATQYAVRVGAINHGDQRKMRNILILAMAGIKPQLDQSEPMAAATEAALEQGLHFALYGELTILQPTEKHFRRYAEQRWNSDERRYIKEIAVDHYNARRQRDTSDEWANARRLRIETRWCEDLHVPFAAEFLGLLAKQEGQCALGNANGRPQWPLSSSGDHEMLSGFRR